MAAMQGAELSCCAFCMHQASIESAYIWSSCQRFTILDCFRFL